MMHHRPAITAFLVSMGIVCCLAAQAAQLREDSAGLELLRQLSERYGRYGLPEPPQTAILAYVGMGEATTGHILPAAERRLALVSSTREAGKRKWYAGPIPVDLYENEVVEPVNPGDAALQGTEPGYAAKLRRRDIDLCTSIYCFRRGWVKLSLEFLRRNPADSPTGEIDHFARVAWSYWEDSLAQSAADRSEAAKYLHRIFQDGDAVNGYEPIDTLADVIQAFSPDLPHRISPKAKVGRRFDLQEPLSPDHARCLLADLDLTLATAGIHHTGIEGEIDDLVNAGSGSDWRMAATLANGYSPGASPASRSLWIRGFEAVPSLLKHVNDHRLARKVMDGVNRYPTHVARVGEIVSSLLYSLAGKGQIRGEGTLTGELEFADPDSANTWWRNARVAGEETYLVAHVLPPANAEDGRPNAYAARILSRKYPSRIPGIYETLIERFPHAYSWDIADILVGAEVLLADKERVLVKAVAAANQEHRVNALSALVQIRSTNAIALLVDRIDRCPPKTATVHADYEAASLAALAEELDEPAGWSALSRLADRSEPQQRLAMLQRLCDVSKNGAQLRHGMELISKYVNDDTYVEVQPAFGFSPIPYGLHTHKISFRDALLPSVAVCLGVKPYPHPGDTGPHWNGWRSKVVDALRKYLATEPGEPVRN